MNIGQVGPFGFSRHPETRVSPLKAPIAAPRLVDLASISPHGRDYLATVEALSRELKHQEPGREERASKVRQQLAEGDLDNDKIYRAVAETIFHGEIFDVESPEAAS